MPGQLAARLVARLQPTCIADVSQSSARSTALQVLNVRLADPTKPLAAWGTTIEINTAALIPAAAMADAYLCRVAAGTSSSVMPRAVGDAGGEQGAGGKEEEEGSVLAEATLQAGSEGEQVVGGGGGAQQQPAAPGAGGGGGGHEPGSSSGVQGLLEQLCPLHLEEWSTRHFGGGSSSDSPAVKAQQVCAGWPGLANVARSACGVCVAFGLPADWPACALATTRARTCTHSSSKCCSRRQRLC